MDGQGIVRDARVMSRADLSVVGSEQDGHRMDGGGKEAIVKTTGLVALNRIPPCSAPLHALHRCRKDLRDGCGYGRADIGIDDPPLIEHGFHLTRDFAVRTTDDGSDDAGYMGCIECCKVTSYFRGNLHGSSGPHGAVPSCAAAIDMKDLAELPVVRLLVRETEGNGHAFRARGGVGLLTSSARIAVSSTKERGIECERTYQR